MQYISSLSDLLHSILYSLGSSMLLQMESLHSFLWVSSILLYIYVPHLYSFIVDGYLGHFYVLAIINSAAMNTGVRADIHF